MVEHLPPPGKLRAPQRGFISDQQAMLHPPLKGEGKGRPFAAEGSPGWGGGGATPPPYPPPPAGEVGRGDLRCGRHPHPARWRGPTSPQPNLAIARVRPLNKVTEVGNSRLRLGEGTGDCISAPVRLTSHFSGSCSRQFACRAGRHPGSIADAGTAQTCPLRITSPVTFATQVLSSWHNSALYVAPSAYYPPALFANSTTQTLRDLQGA